MAGPPIRTVHVPRPQETPFTVSKLVETKQGMIAHLTEMSVVGSSFLMPVDRTFRTVQIQNNPTIGRVLHRTIDPMTIER